MTGANGGFVSFDPEPHESLGNGELRSESQFGGPIAIFQLLLTKETKLGVLSKPWTEEDCHRLRELHAARASVARTALALKRRPDKIRAKARELGIPFQTLREQKKRQKEKEVEARTAAGLSPVQDNPKYRRR